MNGENIFGRENIREMVRQMPEYRDGELTDVQVEVIVNRIYTDKDKLIEQFIEAEIRRELMLREARGEVWQDPETGTYYKTRGD